MQGPADALPSAQALELCVQSSRPLICSNCMGQWEGDSLESFKVFPTQQIFLQLLVLFVLWGYEFINYKTMQWYYVASFFDTTELFIIHSRKPV